MPFFTIAGRSRESAAEEQYDVVGAIAEAHDATPAQVRIAWTLALGPHVLAIPGTGDAGHLEENVAAASLRLTDDDLGRPGHASPERAQPDPPSVPARTGVSCRPW